MPEQRNLILAIVLSVTIIIAFQYFYELPRIHDARQQQAVRTEQTIEESEQPAGAGTGEVAPSPPGASQGVAGTAADLIGVGQEAAGQAMTLMAAASIVVSLSLVPGLRRSRATAPAVADPATANPGPR